MSVSLQKGQKVSLTKGNAGLSNVVVGLGWDVNQYHGANFDLDAAAFLLNDAGKITSKSDFVFFANLKHPSGAVIHSGDNLTGQGDGDDEQIKIDLSKVPANCARISIVVAIYSAAKRSQNFGMVQRAYIRIFDAQTQEELLRYDLTEDYSVETAVVFGELYRHNGEWKFSAVGSGFQGELADACKRYI